MKTNTLKPINEDNQIIKASLIGMSQKDNWMNGAEIQHTNILSESKTFGNVTELEKWLSSFGLELKNFRRFNHEDEPYRLDFSRNEDGNGNEITLSKQIPDGFLVDYSLYLEVYTLATDEDYLIDFDGK